jgi:hypothetical protein
MLVETHSQPGSFSTSYPCFFKGFFALQGESRNLFGPEIVDVSG